MGIKPTLERVKAAFREGPKAALREWAKVAFRRRGSGRHARPAPPPAATHEPRTPPAPGVLGTRLAVVRRHREERHVPPVQAPPPEAHAEWFPPRSWEDQNIVRPYVANLGETPGSARTGGQADLRGDAR